MCRRRIDAVFGEVCVEQNCSLSRLFDDRCETEENQIATTHVSVSTKLFQGQRNQRIDSTFYLSNSDERGRTCILTIRVRSIDWY
jgi:hypothetical protein